MFSEFEHQCLTRLASEWKRSGLDLAQTQKRIEADFAGFCTAFHIRRAVESVFRKPRGLT